MGWVIERKDLLLYNSEMTNILTSHTAKQLLGACAGMAIAGVVYLAVDHVDNFTIKGLLVDTTTVQTDGVSINAKDANDATIRRIAQRAATVAATLENSTIPTQAETPLTVSTAERLAERLAEAQREDLAATAKTYSNDPNVVMSEEDRLAIRAARVAGLPAPAVAPKPLPYAPAPVQAEVVSQAPVVVANIQAMHAGAETPPVLHSTNLPSSGLGLNLLVLVTLVSAFALSKTTWRHELASMIQGLRIG